MIIEIDAVSRGWIEEYLEILKKYNFRRNMRNTIEIKDVSDFEKLIKELREPLILHADNDKLEITIYDNYIE
jgi:predicted KAP-like P-loop ATPase